MLEPVVLEALAARLKHIGERKPLPSSPTVADIMAAIARLGGHNKSNGPPGWKLLWRGLGTCSCGRQDLSQEDHALPEITG